ncbi:hypothetical protein Misp01_43590 [Microtetraspora sp. NBRC 13810]|uniref:hypothetical protein n=1 Tax=Microtetraspora sp. NBRC 13810 TaxID=3030990 RepID=UPI0024A4903C|nr:hypothetical protein [Microtetraspora sp. NBRC 13810]GLW09230.1 hypothetical protein Misp01_43590 [Microtetraspora sp. NBRC 13810]
MPDRAALDEMRKVLDEVYRDRPRATRREIYSCASGHVMLPAEMLARLHELPEGVYSRREVDQALGRLAEPDDASGGEGRA